MDLAVVRADLESGSLAVRSWRVEKEDGLLVVDAALQGRRHQDVLDAVARLVDRPGARTVHRLD